MVPVTPFNASDITDRARRELLLLLEGVRYWHRRTRLLVLTLLD